MVLDTTPRAPEGATPHATRFATILPRLRQDLAACLTPEAVTEPAVGRDTPGGGGSLTPSRPFISSCSRSSTAIPPALSSTSAAGPSPTALLSGPQTPPACVFQRRAGADRRRRPSRHRRRSPTGSATGSGSSTARASRCPTLPSYSGLRPAWRPAPGCGFPVAKWLALFDVATGMLLRSSTAPLRSHEMARAAGGLRRLEPGDIVLADRGFCSYAHLALLAAAACTPCSAMHQRQIVDFTPGRPQARRGSQYRPGLPHSRWVRAQGDSDQVVIWYKPKSKPVWMTAEEYAALPAETTVRELRYRVESPGFRRRVTVVTTLLDAAVYPASALAELYSGAG